MLRLPICELLSIEFPIIQGGMAWVADAHLAAAVSNAGGMGLIAGMSMNGEQLRAEIHKARSLTDKPFGVNIMLMSPHTPEVAKVVIEEKIPVVTTGAGNPASYIKAWKEAGIQVLPVVASSGLAKMMERAGADAVIAEGCEAGGHIGELTTMALLPQVCDAVKNIPVIAAGGIADGRGLAAAVMLGAAGAQLGTAFLVAEECTIHENYKKRVLAAKDIDTLTTGHRFGHPVRALKSNFTRTYRKKEFAPESTQEELEALGVGALRRAAREGDEENGCFMAGQSAGLQKSIRPARQIMEEMTAQAEEILKGAARWVK
jgi:enoyl-[acyl-carrier protein] reductase II